MKVLLVEDEKELAGAIAYYLAQEGYLCETAPDYKAGLMKIEDSEYDCLLLDITLPGGNGLDILSKLKSKKPEASVIIISAKNSLDDKIKGLDLGADDYLVKPFHLPELNARLKSVIRRRNFGGSNEIVVDEISINTAGRQVMVKGEPIVLTKREYDLLLFFISNANRVITKESIVNHLWDDDNGIDSYDVIYSYIKNIRKKIMDKGGDDHIQTIYGLGYKFLKK